MGPQASCRDHWVPCVYILFKPSLLLVLCHSQPNFILTNPNPSQHTSPDSLNQIPSIFQTKPYAVPQCICFPPLPCLMLHLDCFSHDEILSLSQERGILSQISYFTPIKLFFIPPKAHDSSPNPISSSFIPLSLPLALYLS